MLLFIGYGASSLAATGLMLLSQSLIVGALPASRALGPAVAQLIMPIGAGLLLACGFVAHAAHRARTAAPVVWSDPPSSGSGPLALGVALAVVSACAWLSLGALASLCADAAAMMRETGWLGASTPERSALLLLPFAAALIVPALQLAGACAFGAGAVAVLALGSAPARAGVARTLSLCLIVQTALTGASAYGAAASDALLGNVESAVRGTAMSHLPISGRRLALEVLERYRPTVESAAFTLDLALLAHVVAAGLFFTLRTNGARAATRPVEASRDPRALLQMQAARALARDEPPRARGNGFAGALMLAAAALLLVYAVFGRKALEPLLSVVGLS